VANLDLVTILVEDYDRAITWFTDVLGFSVYEDRPATTTDGRPKRWVVVRPTQGGTGFVLAQPDSALQHAAFGAQTGDRVSFFLRVPDFDERLAVMRAAGVRLLGEPRAEPYGSVVVFLDPFGNRWDLLGPPASG
jgi:catechol 2,3-dioxygenase-like lactoylglutathione lyase family enzyme